MVSITVPIENKLLEKIEQLSWVNWSDVARERLKKREIFERYLKLGTITDEDWKFCDKIDWHPVDELPLREEFAKELKERKKGPFIKLNSVDELFEK